MRSLLVAFLVLGLSAAAAAQAPADTAAPLPVCDALSCAPTAARAPSPLPLTAPAPPVALPAATLEQTRSRRADVAALDLRLAELYAQRRRSNFIPGAVMMGVGALTIGGSLAYLFSQWTHDLSDALAEEGNGRNHARIRRERNARWVMLGGGVTLALGGIWLINTLPRWLALSREARNVRHQKRDLMLQVSPVVGAESAGILLRTAF